MGIIQFRGDLHRTFYLNCIQAAGSRADSYYNSFAYLMGLTDDTRAHFSECFDTNEWCIVPESLDAAWQTSGSLRITRLAFNLWNGWSYNNLEDADTSHCSSMFTPENIFDCEFAPFFCEAIKLRYPEYMRLEVCKE